MKRRMMERLVAWRDDPSRKPLILDGARQVGKSWLVKEFGRTHFQSMAYVSLEGDASLRRLFEGNPRPERLISGLSLASGVPIAPHDTLIVLDEVQSSPKAVESLKYFSEEAPEYPLVATGSSLGITIHPGVSYPVGKVDRLRLLPMDFVEFLNACGQEPMAALVEGGDTAMMAVFHEQLMEWLRYYMVVGGMPEAVTVFASTYPGVDYEAVRRAQQGVIGGYREDFSKYADDMPRGFSLRLAQVWDSMPSQLARENKKFLYGAVRSGGRGKDFELAIQRLLDCSIALKVPRVSAPEYPLRAFADPAAFKLFASDVGLLREMSGIDPRIILEADDVFRTAKGAFTEQYVCQELVAAGWDPKYWTNENSTNELDFLIQCDGVVVPIEAKAGDNLHAKSLKAAIKRFGFTRPVRLSAREPRHDGAIIDLPLYAIVGLRNILDGLG